MILTGTDAQIVRPYKSLFVPASIPIKARRVATCRDARTCLVEWYPSYQSVTAPCRDARSSVRCVKARRVAICRDARSVRPLCQSETYNNERRPLQQSPLLFYAPTSLLDILILMEDALRVHKWGLLPTILTES